MSVDTKKVVTALARRTSASAVLATKPVRKAAPSLSLATEEAWEHPRHWVTISPPESGVAGVLCSPRTSKQGVNYWLWGYRMREGQTIWRASRMPLR